MLKASAIIESSIKTFFSHHFLPRTRDEKVFHTGDIVVNCRKDNLTLEWVGKSCEGAIFSHRASPILHLISEIINKESMLLDCRIILGPHDSIDKGDPKDRGISKVGFCCPSDSPHLAIPDPHYLSYVANPIIDITPFEQKKDRVVFRGTDGSMDRVIFAARSAKKEFLDCKVSRFLSHNESSLLEEGININEVRGDWMNHQDQLKYKYILDMYGHSIGWDRPCWGLPSNSILILIPPEGNRALTWYYPSIIEKNIIPEFSMHDLLNTNSLEQYTQLLPEQQSFGKEILKPSTVYNFMKEFLLVYNAHYNS